MSDLDTVWYIDIEREASDGARDAKVKRIAAASGCDVPVCTFRDLINNAASIDSMQADNVMGWFVSGNISEWSTYNARELVALQAFLKDKQGAMPMFAVCGGHQLLAMAYGGSVAHMACVGSDGDDSTCPEAYASAPVGWKTVDVSVPDASDPIFAGLSSYKFNFSHHDEVTVVPSSFTLLASTSACTNQLLKYTGEDDKLLYTSQFHPEYSLNSDAGYDLLVNFFKLARAKRTP